MIKFWKELSYERKWFIVFLIVHLVVWSCIGLIRTVLPTDSLEGIYWGSLQDFGTPKHPPLAGWLTYITYSVFKTDFSIYLLSQAFIILGFVYIYKLAKCFLDETKSILSVILLEGCWCYTYVSGYYGFNPDVILLGILPLMTYYFYKCMRQGGWKNWIILGLITGFCFLNKYQTALTLLPMAIWAFMYKREVYKSPKFYTSVLIAFLIFLPHILWLIKYDFFPFLYFDGELSSPSWVTHITAPLMFLVMQFAAIAGPVVLYFFFMLVNKQPIKLRDTFEKQDLWFILLFGFLPLVIHLLMGFFEGGTMRPRWGFEFWYMLGIMLFYFFPCKIEKKEFNFFLKMALFALVVTFIAMGTLLSVEKNYRSRYPVPQVYSDIKKVWEEQTHTPMKYMGGYIEWTLPLVIYDRENLECLLDTFGYPSPWIDEEDFEKSGAFFIDRTVEELETHLRKAYPDLPEEFEFTPVEYKFTLTNAFNQPREYTVYYYIVPPKK